MDMSGMSMSMDMASTTVASAASTAMSMAGMASTATAAASAASSTAMSMGGMGGMDMGSSSSDACKISMLWNWTTINSCFLARSWHIRSKGGFAGSCIGVVFLGIAVELVRRLQREYDRYIYAKHLVRLEQQQSISPAESPDGKYAGPNNNSIFHTFFGQSSTSAVPDQFIPSFFQQAVRALFYVIQYAGAYFIMLLAMYYNGYIIICIFIGGYLGNFIFGNDSFLGAKVGSGPVKTEKTCCC